MDRRTFLRLAAAGVALPALASCGAARSGVIRFEGWDYEAQLVQQNVDLFTSRNPGVEVDYTPITSAQFIRKLTAEFLGGAGPDVLYMYDDSLAGSVEAEYLRPLDDIPGVAEVYDAIYPSNAAAMVYGGKRYGLPYYTDMQALVYNAAILEKAGISAPPRTLDELEQQALRIKDAGILQFPIGLPAQLADTAALWTWALVYANGQDLFDEQLAPVMSAPGSATVAVFEWLTRVTRGSAVLDPACVQTLPIPMDNAVMAGQYAFVLAPRYALRSYNDPAKSQVAGAIRLAPVPSLDGAGEGTVSSTRMYCLGRDSTRSPEVSDGAIRLLHHFGGFDASGDPATARFWFLERGLGFPFPQLAQDPEVLATLETFADPGMYSHLAETARARTVTAAPWYAEFETALQRTTQQVLIGDTDPAAAAAGLDAETRVLAERYA
jgi:multiple sugar transport system substrate-binding protein